jgi:signal transduction histidine kinase
MKMNARVLADSLAQQRDDRESVNWIIREIDRMDQVVGDLLNLRDIVGNDEKKVLSMLGPSRNVDMTALIMQTTQNLGRRCEHAGVKLTCNVAPDANRALANPDAVRQVIMNLVLNALDAVAGRENATIDVNVTAAGNDVIRATVTDNGAGLDSETDRLFEPFYTTKPHGTGLGLYIGKQIVEAYGGRIGCEYRRPGAAFWFELPKATSDG